MSRVRIAAIMWMAAAKLTLPACSIRTRAMPCSSLKGCSRVVTCQPEARRLITAGPQGPAPLGCHAYYRIVVAESSREVNMCPRVTAWRGKMPPEE